MFFKETNGQILPNDHFGHPAHPPVDPSRPDKPEQLEHPDHPHPPERPDHPEKPIVVIVNGVDKVLPVGTSQLSYEDVVRLAEGSYDNSSNVIYTVGYSHGPAENKHGQLVRGESVFVREGMVFNVGRSNKS